MDEQALMAALRAQFLQDPDDQFAALRDAAAPFRDQPVAAARALLRVIHGIKGSAQASGLKRFAQLMHDLETVFVGIEPRQPGSEDLALGGTHIAACLADVAICATSLKGVTGEPEELFAPCRLSVETLRSWIAALPAKIIEASSDADASAVVADEAKVNFKAPSGSAELGWELFGESGTEQVQGWGVFEEQDAAPPAEVATALASAGMAADLNVALTSSPAASSYLLFERHGQSFALPVVDVRKIVADQPTSVLPAINRAPHQVVALGDEGVLPLFGLGGLKPPVDSPLKTRSLILCQHGDRRFALRVDRVTQVVEIAPGDLQPTPAAAPGRPQRPAQFITKVAGQTVLVLDTARLAEA